MSDTTTTADGAAPRTDSIEGLAGFSRRSGELFCEEISARELARRFQTPLYAYSRQALEHNIADWRAGVAGTPHRVFYAMKANGSLALLELFARAGLGFDIVSRGELARALAVGAKGCDIVYSGVGKSLEDMRAALAADVLCFNVESLPELERLNAAALEMGTTARVSLRVNPDVDARTHPYISTGLKNNKFGIAFDSALEGYRRAARLPGLKISGIDFHIGSQITELEPFVHAAHKVLDLVEEISGAGIALEHIDFGGGLGVRYGAENPPAARELVSALSQCVRERGFGDLPLFFEPGRSLVAQTGLLLTTVEYVKPTAARNFCIVDAAMTDMIRPTLYQAEMSMVNCSEHADAAPAVYDVVGPVCESGDFLAKNRLLDVREGDVLAMTGAGAYGMSMASNYNARGRAAEVLVDKDSAWLIRRRETIEDQMALESRLPLEVL